MSDAFRLTMMINYDAQMLVIVTSHLSYTAHPLFRARVLKKKQKKKNKGKERKDRKFCYHLVSLTLL